MRTRYETRGIVLSRSPLGEANAFVTLITPGLGLVRARAQGVRRPGARLAASLVTFAESSLVLVLGKEGWRVAGAVLEENWFTTLQNTDARRCAARISGLILRLVGGEAHDPALFSIILGFFEALVTLSEEAYETAEVLAALRVLASLGFDAGHIPGDSATFTPAILAAVTKNRASYITRINHGLTASGL